MLILFFFIDYTIVTTNVISSIIQLLLLQISREYIFLLLFEDEILLFDHYEVQQ